MKKNNKKIVKALGVGCLAAFLLTGCSPAIPNIENESTELLYNEGSAVVVGDYAFFGNAYKEVGSSTNDYTYSENSQLSYLSRVNTTELENYSATSPEASIAINDKIVVGFEHQYMFALGDYIYYTSPNTQPFTNDTTTIDYSRVSFWRSHFDGTNGERYFTTDNSFGSAGQISALRGSDDNYYLVIYDGTDLSSVRLGDNLGTVETIAEDVKSVALPDEKDNYTICQVYYTAAHTDENGATSSSQIDVFAVDYATGDKKDLSDGKENSNVELKGRVNDVIFYTSSAEKEMENYLICKDVSSGDTAFAGATINIGPDKIFYDSPEITDIQGVGLEGRTGYIFTSSDKKSIMFKNSGASHEQASILLSNNGNEYPLFSAVLFARGEYVYYSTESGISAINIYTKEVKNIVEMSNIVAGQFGFDGKYIYFYSQILDDPNSDIEYEEDTNSYMYRVDVEGEKNYQMLSRFTRTEKEETDSTN